MMDMDIIPIFIYEFIYRPFSDMMSISAGQVIASFTCSIDPPLTELKKVFFSFWVGTGLIVPFLLRSTKKRSRFFDDDESKNDFHSFKDIQVQIRIQPSETD